MPEPERFYPKEANLGKPCVFWDLGRVATGSCAFPKAELEGRTTCRGVIDDVCLKILRGRPASPISEMLMEGNRLSFSDGTLLPPGEIV